MTLLCKYLSRWLRLPTGNRWQRLGARWQPAESDGVGVEEAAPEPEEAEAEPEAAGRMRLLPLPPAAALLEVSGGTQADADSLLLRAAGAGNVMRLRAALLRGCDLEACDECGPSSPQGISL